MARLGSKVLRYTQDDVHPNKTNGWIERNRAVLDKIFPTAVRYQQKRLNLHNEGSVVEIEWTAFDDEEVVA